MGGMSATEPTSRALARKASVVCGPPEILAKSTVKPSSSLARPDSSSATLMLGSPTLMVVPAGTDAASGSRASWLIRWLPAVAVPPHADNRPAAGIARSAPRARRRVKDEVPALGWGGNAGKDMVFLSGGGFRVRRRHPGCAPGWAWEVDATAFAAGCVVLELVRLGWCLGSAY